ncbi:MAG: LamG domain-containing protein [Microcystis aeruginosa Ma_AC_P_19900807_S299]|jgi:hypothetical protein|nr:MAG: LamG domain-containing protein [Microcystis aeruginosa Ma_AC_P_19900807_S299]
MNFNKIILVTGAIAVSTFVIAPVQAATILSHWTFDETGGTIAADSVGGQNGILQGNATLVGGGISGNAISLSQATNDLVNMGNIYGFTNSNFSISAWINSTVLNDNFVVAKHTAGIVSGYMVFVNGINPGERQLTKAGFYAPFPNRHVLHGNTTVTDGDWHQIAVVYEQGGNSLLYVDGILDAITASDPIGATSAPFLVGGVAVGSQPTGLYTGLIDDVQVYSGALSASDIQFLYHNPGVAIGESSSIPEPSSILGILSLGVLGIGAALKRKS